MPNQVSLKHNQRGGKGQSDDETVRQNVELAYRPDSMKSAPVGVRYGTISDGDVIEYWDDYGQRAIPLQAYDQQYDASQNAANMIPGDSDSFLVPRYATNRFRDGCEFLASEKFFVDMRMYLQSLTPVNYIFDCTTGHLINGVRLYFDDASNWNAELYYNSTLQASVTTSYSISTNAWHNIRLVADGSTLRIVVDGTDIGTDTFSFSGGNNQIDQHLIFCGKATDRQSGNIDCLLQGIVVGKATPSFNTFSWIEKGSF